MPVASAIHRSLAGRASTTSACGRQRSRYEARRGPAHLEAARGEHALNTTTMVNAVTAFEALSSATARIASFAEVSISPLREVGTRGRDAWQFESIRRWRFEASGLLRPPLFRAKGGSCLVRGSSN